MNKQDAKPNAWDQQTEQSVAPAAKTKSTPAPAPAPQVEANTEMMFDLEGLKTDFPTAKELEKFLFDRTGHSIDLKGRSNQYKYQTALDILNGAAPPTELFNPENPYLDKNDLVPVDTLREVPPPPQEIAGHYIVTTFVSRTFPHPDTQWKASGQKCDVIFRKYTNNAITYEVIGPVAPRAVGVRVNKYGKEVPEKYEWVDPRTGEQLIRNENGLLTPLGTRLRSYMARTKVNKSTAWDTWIDRDFVLLGGGGASLDNPWGN